MSNKIKIIDLARQLNLGVESITGHFEGHPKFAKGLTANSRLGIGEVQEVIRAHSKDLDKAKVTKVLEDLNQPVAEKPQTETSKVAVETPAPKAVQEISTQVPEDLKPKLTIKDKIDIEVKTKPKSTEPKPAQEAPVSPKVTKEKAEPKVQKEPLSKETKQEPKKEEVVASKADTQTPVKETKKDKPVDEAPSKPQRDKEVQINAKVPEVTPEPKVAPEEKKPDADGIYRPSIPQSTISFKVVDKIDLDAINSATRPASRKSKNEKDKQRKRTRVNAAVDVKAEAAKIGHSNNQAKKGENKGQNKSNNNGGNQANPNARNNHGNNHGSGGNGQQQGRKAKKQQSLQAKKPEVSDEDVQRQVKETLARLTGNKTQQGKGAKYRKDKRNAARNAAQDAQDALNQESRVLKLTEFVTVSDLANMMDIPVTQVIGTCMSLGLMVSINMRLEAETIDIVAEEFGFKTEFVSAELVEAIGQDEEVDNEEDLQSRPPIVTVMGHVDHGKTSLLDRLRNTNVIDGEAGGITQHIGAYSVKLKSGKRVTFLDTPGHEAFTAMRARGAKVTDIAIIIVAADDDVMPQTKEAINHAAAAGVPMVFAINKIDKPGANPDRIREQLAAMNYLVEDWGGKYQCQEISAKQGLNIEELLEKVLLEAEILELKANPNRKAIGSIIESSLDKGRGYTSTVLVQNGTLSTGDVVLVGTYHGKVRAMFNERNQKVDKAGPSEPVLILGLNGAPTAGETFNVMDTEQEARSIANKREQLRREQDTRTKKGLTLDELARRRAVGNFQELNIIVKGDVDGSIEALSDSLIRLSTEEIQVNVIHKGVGQISESDVVLASASSAIIVGFQVRPSQAARRAADKEGVEIRTYSIIYDTIEDIKSAMEGMLSPEIKENVVANLEVLQTFKITKVGTIAGCMVLEGKIKRNNKIRLIRDGIVKYAGALGSLKRYKDDAKEVVMGQECGLNIDGYNDIMAGDIIEAYEEIEIKKTLD